MGQCVRSCAQAAPVSTASPKEFGVGEDSISSPRRLLRRPAPRFWLTAACLLAGLRPGSLAAADMVAAHESFQTGNYAEALKAAEEESAIGYSDVRWWRLRVRSLTVVGRYREATEVLDAALRQHYADAPLRVLGYEPLRLIGKAERAEAVVAELLRLATGTPWRYQSADDRVWLGRAAVLMGADAREVLEGFYDYAIKQEPDNLEAAIAAGELALAKHDDGVAAETFRKALEKHPQDADLLCGLARAVAGESDLESKTMLVQALERNPRHLPSLFVVAEDALDHQDYAATSATLTKIFTINPIHPKAWALAAALAHVQADALGEFACREIARTNWRANPEVDHFIGAKLSSAYRFAEGAAYQRLALSVDKDYLPARAQLAQDLLRLGEADEGWKLVAEVQEADPYDVVAYNLANLRDKLEQYVTLKSPHFELHMDRREAAVYGPRVQALLERAQQTLGDKYGWHPTKPVTVEILTTQSDFAIRTFGLPGGDGILGVCFGTVITANSPAALPGRTTNWEATLWHEYCHVVTLEMTRHRIPRWLSEGISVYEERQANPTWGDRLDRETRQMILGGELSLIANLHQAFRNPKSSAHFDLAYYQASLVVEFLVQKLGFPTLRRVLEDVAAGMPINDSLALRTGSLDGFEESFVEFAENKAHEYGPDVDWQDDDLPPIPQGPAASIAAWLQERPQHYRGRFLYARALMKENDFPEARKVLESLVKDVPQWAGDESPYFPLAKTLQELKESAAERAVLEASAARSEDALETYRRLIQIAVANKDADALQKNVERFLAVDPLQEYPYRNLAEQGIGERSITEAAAAARSLLALEPADVAGTHFLLAKLLHAAKDPEAKRHALLALEETPRYRDAQRLLLAIVDEKQGTEQKPIRPPTRVEP